MQRVLSMVVLLLSAACSHPPPTDVQRNVREIQIGDSVEPRVLYAKPGEEVRWHNLRTTPIKLGFLTTTLLREISCQEGIRTLFGDMKDFISIAPQKSVSVCFVLPGELKYNVWLDPDNPHGAISPTGTIRVETGS